MAPRTDLLALVRDASEAAKAATEARDAAIAAATTEHSFAKIALAAGLSKSRVQQIVQRERARA